jgi:hypothetical protein
LNPFDPGRLKAPSFNPCAYEVKKLVSKFGFIWVNLYRYIMAHDLELPGIPAGERLAVMALMVGQPYQSNPVVTHGLKAPAWFFNL